MDNHPALRHQKSRLISTATQGEPLCEVRDVYVRYNRWGQTVEALRGLSLSVEDDEWVMLVGPNGSGKSTLLKVLSGRLHPDDGYVIINGSRITSLDPSERAQHVFLVHQDPLLGSAATLTVFENLKVADAKGSSLNRSQLEDRYRELLQPVGLEDRMGHRAQALSGGERQLLSLTIARLRPASLILLDEPLAALDPKRRETCLRQISALKREGRTLVHVTHNPDDAISHGDRTVGLSKGSVAADMRGADRDLKSLRSFWMTHERPE